jgi:hypothetical protein
VAGYKNKLSIIFLQASPAIKEELSIPAETIKFPRGFFLQHFFKTGAFNFPISALVQLKIAFIAPAGFLQ